LETRLIRSATLLGFPEAAQEVGLDPAQILRAVGLDIGCLEDPDTLIPLDSFFDALALAADESGFSDFAIRSAYRRGVPDLGPVTLLMREAETVEEAIRFYSTHISMHADGFVLQLDKRFDSPVIIVELRGRTREASIQAAQFAVAGVIMTIRWLIGSDFQPELVSFSHARPQKADFLNRFLKCPVSYNQILSGMIIAARDLQRPVTTSSPYLRKQALKYLTPAVPRPHSFEANVGRLIAQMLANGTCSASMIADYLDIDRRTLNRRLEKEGETFSSVLQKVRVDITLRYIVDKDYPVTDLAGLIGFNGLSSFSRWFHTTFGCSATEWRAKPELMKAAGTSNANHSL